MGTSRTISIWQSKVTYEVVLSMNPCTFTKTGLKGVERIWKTIPLPGVVALSGVSNRWASPGQNAPIWNCHKRFPAFVI